MKELMDVYQMTEVSKEVRAKLIYQLCHLVNAQHCMNIAEPLAYELIKLIDPSSKYLEILLKTMKKSEDVI